MKPIIFTIGHSTRSIEEFVFILRKYGINQLIDIRTIPGSKHNPQFNKKVLANYLRARSINYRHMKKLGGLRHTTKNSINTGLTNASFRGYADYMQTDEFKKNLKKLIAIAKKKHVAIMCAEALPFRCHRSLVADALVAQKVGVRHIYGLNSVKKHTMRSFARIHDGTVYYP